MSANTLPDQFEKIGAADAATDTLSSTPIGSAAATAAERLTYYRISATAQNGSGDPRPRPEV